MTEEAKTEIATATTSEGTQSKEATSTSTTSTTQSDFAIPEAYKEKGWSKNLKSTDDVWKMLDNSQALAGKKMVVPDFDKGDPKEIEEYVNNLRPKDKAAYKLSDAIPEEERGVISEIIHKVGLPAPMANKLMEGLMEHVTGASQKMYDKDGFMAELKTSFGDGYEKTAGDTAKVLASNLNDADKAMLEKVPNQYLGLIYRLTAGLHKAYGASESGAGGEGGSTKVGTADKSAEQKQIRGEIAALEKKPHTAEEKQKLLNNLAATYK